MDVPCPVSIRAGLCVQAAGAPLTGAGRGCCGAAERGAVGLPGPWAAVPQPEGQSCCSPPRSPALGWHSGGARGLRPGRGAVPESLSAGYVSPLSSLPPLPFPVYLSRSTHTHAPMYLFFSAKACRAQQLGAPPSPGQSHVPLCPVVSPCPVSLSPHSRGSRPPSARAAGGRGAHLPDVNIPAGEAGRNVPLPARRR